VNRVLSTTLSPLQIPIISIFCYTSNLSQPKLKCLKTHLDLIVAKATTVRSLIYVVIYNFTFLFLCNEIRIRHSYTTGAHLHMQPFKARDSISQTCIRKDNHHLILRSHLCFFTNIFISLSSLRF